MFTTKYMKNQPKPAKRVGRYEEGGEVQKLEMKKMPSGASQYVRGGSRSDRMKTLINADKVAAKQDDDAYNDVVAARGDSKKHAAAMEKWDSSFKAKRQLHEAFMDEADDKD